VLYHGGEPLLNKNLPLYIKTLKEMGVVKTVITTNASLMTEEISHNLIEAGLDEMKVSFDGTSPEENDRIRTNGNFVRDSANVKNFLRVRERLSKSLPHVIISNIQIGGEAKTMPSYLTEQFTGVEFRTTPSFLWVGSKEYQNYNVIAQICTQPTYCGFMFETITILANGDIVPCCYDLQGKQVMGNAFEDGIFNVWENEQYTGLRNGFKIKKYTKLCLKCNVVSKHYLERKN
jgi:radical SAM protein with 4Fe4S-binding SPASM domain